MAMTDTSTGSRVLTGFFDNRTEADSAAERLRAADVPSSAIRITGAESGGTGAGAPEEKGFFESLSDFFFPEEDRYTYEEGLRRGGYLVTVTAEPGTEDRVLDILEDAGAVDLDEREASWRSEGWAGYTGSTSATGERVGTQTGFAESRSDFSGRSEGESVDVVEEELHVGKRDRSHGRVRVRSYVREEPVSAEVDLKDERVEVERRPVDRPAEVGEGAFRERSIEAEEQVEEPVVRKEARVVEEVGLRKESDTHRETVSDTVRKTDVEVERDDDIDRR
jgi:stress response protein YsnF